MNKDCNIIWLALMLTGILVTGCSKPSNAPVASAIPTPAICDFTQFENKPPDFVKSAFPNRQWTTTTYPHWDRTTKRPVKSVVSCGILPNIPYIGASFYDNKLFEVMVFFWDDISPKEAARRVGLPLSAFRITAPETEQKRFLRFTGMYRGVHFKELTITDHPFRNGSGSRNVIVTFSVPGVS
jgi:hypothetical protein